MDVFSFFASMLPFFLEGLQLLWSVVRSERRFPPVLDASRLQYFFSSTGPFGEGVDEYEMSSMLSISDNTLFSPEFYLEEISSLSLFNQSFDTFGLSFLLLLCPPIMAYLGGGRFIFSSSVFANSSICLSSSIKLSSFSIWST